MNPPEVSSGEITPQRAASLGLAFLFVLPVAFFAGGWWALGFVVVTSVALAIWQRPRPRSVAAGYWATGALLGWVMVVSTALLLPPGCASFPVPFHSGAWKAGHGRHHMADHLIDSERLIGLRADEVVDLLGPRTTDYRPNTWLVGRASLLGVDDLWIGVEYDQMGRVNRAWIFGD